MLTSDLILAQEFCLYHHVEITFIHTLARQGLISVVTVEQADYVRPEQLNRLEKLTRLHQELAIHPDDLDIVENLLEQVQQLQQQVAGLQNRLHFYE